MKKLLIALGPVVPVVVVAALQLGAQTPSAQVSGEAVYRERLAFAPR